MITTTSKASTTTKFTSAVPALVLHSQLQQPLPLPAIRSSVNSSTHFTPSTTPSTISYKLLNHLPSLIPLSSTQSYSIIDQSSLLSSASDELKSAITNILLDPIVLERSKILFTIKDSTKPNIRDTKALDVLKLASHNYEYVGYFVIATTVMKGIGAGYSKNTARFVSKMQPFIHHFLYDKAYPNASANCFTGLGVKDFLKYKIHVSKHEQHYHSFLVEKIVPQLVIYKRTNALGVLLRAIDTFEAAEDADDDAGELDSQATITDAEDEI